MRDLLKVSRQTLARSAVLAIAIIALLCGSPQSRAQAQIPVGMRAQAASLAKTCKEDYERSCKGVQPGGGRILACLKSNADTLSAACRGALADAQKL